jgi:cullin 3
LYTLFIRVPDDVGRNALRTALKGDIEERGKVINEGGIIPAGAGAGPSQDGAAAEGGEEDEEMEGKGKGKAKEKGGSSGKAVGGAGALSLALGWVQGVLDLKDKFDKVLDEAFGGDKAIQTSINEVSLYPQDMRCKS